MDPDITYISAVPTQLYRATPIYKNLKCLLIGGAPISTFPDRLPCYLSYGLTEMGSIVTAGFKSLGFPLPGREMRIVDQEIEVRGDTLFQGYWGEKKQEGWFATGDLGKRSRARKPHEWIDYAVEIEEKDFHISLRLLIF